MARRGLPQQRCPRHRETAVGIYAKKLGGALRAPADGLDGTAAETEEPEHELRKPK